MNPNPTTNGILQSEAHLHLYGCLRAEDLWSIGKDRYQQLTPRMEWFAKEYAAAFNMTPTWRLWWETDHGFTDFKETFIFAKPGPFSAFQAKFNLLIALNPPTPGEYSLVRRVLAGHEAEGGIKEYRTFLPMYLADQDREAYVLGLLGEVRERTSSAFQPLIALSLFRTPEVAETAYAWLNGFCLRHPWTMEYLTGIDFCGSEHGHPPKLKQAFIERLYYDNQIRTRPWHVLYHVGEMWDQISLASAARWVVESCQYGVTRIGHGMALGVEPTILLGQITTEPLAEFLDHLKWLEYHAAELAAFGYTTKHRTWWHDQGVSFTKNGLVTWHWSVEHCEHVRILQDALLHMLKPYQPLIEVCVTSNMRIGSLRTASDHPLKRFLDHQLQICASTDDPGIFDLSLRSEEQILRETFGCSKEELQRFEGHTRAWLQGDTYHNFKTSEQGKK